jgi:hypothetical protein
MTMYGIFVTLLILNVPSTKAQENTVDISGTVINRSPAGDPHFNRIVILHIFLDDGLSTFKSTSTDDQGSFHFTADRSNKIIGYLLVANHRGVDYELEIAPDRNRTDNVILEIYETTDKVDAIELLSNSLMIADWDISKRTISVFEIVQIGNKGNRTFVPNLNEPAKMAFLRFPLAREAADLQVQTQLPEGQVIQVDRGFGLTTPVPPGEHGIAFTYTINYQGDNLDLSRSFSRGNKSFRILQPHNIGSLISSNLTQESSATIGDSTFDIFQIENIPPGDVIDILIQDIPQPSFFSQLQEALKTSVSIWIIPAVLSLALIFLIVIGLRARRQEPTRVSASLAGKDEIIREIIDLDNKFEINKISEDDYLRQRNELKNSALRSVLSEDNKE